MNPRNEFNILGKSLRMFLGGICLLILAFPFHFQQNQREEYERFLMNQYTRISPVATRLSPVEGAADFPDLAAIRNFFMTLDPGLGYIPHDRLNQALNASETSLKTDRQSSPAWIGVPSHTGGRTRTVMFDPNDTLHQTLWAGAVTGGLWYNEHIMDTTSSWLPVSDLWPGMAISCIVSDPNNPQVFYVGTGEPQTAFKTYRESTGVGFGIYRTGNGGKTWELIPSTEPFRYITDLAVRDENGQSVVYAGVVSGWYQGEEHPSLPTDGLYRSDNGGATWEQVLPTIQGIFLPYAPSDIEISSAGRIFIGTMPNLQGKGGAIILWSDSGEKGTWQKVTDYADLIHQEPDWNLPGRVMLATAPSSPDRVYAVIASGKKEIVPEFYEWYGNYIIRSDDHGASWASCSLPNELPPGYTNFANIAWHALTIGVDPNNPDIVYAGGLNIHRSTNGGQSWSRICMGNPDPTTWYTFVHVDEHTIVFKPGSSSQMVTTNDGGVFFSGNVNGPEPVFTEINRNYNTLQFYTCAIGPDTTGNRYMGGTQDDGTLFYEGIPFTMDAMIAGGDGAFCCFDRFINRPLVASAFFNSYFFFPDGAITPFPDFKWTGTFINAADFDYLNNTLYANAVTYDHLYPGSLIVIDGVPFNPDGRIVDLGTGNAVPFTAVKVSPYSTVGSSTLFLGTQSGRLYKVSHAQTDPVAEGIGSVQFPTANIVCVDVGRSDQELLVSFSNYGIPSVWLTQDGGDTWMEREGNLPDIPVRWGIFHPENTKTVMLATELGVWFTEDILASEIAWEQSANGLPNVRTDMITIRKADSKVLAGTHGRGMFTTTLPVSVPDRQKADEPIRAYPNPATDRVTISFHIPSTQQGVLTLVDLKGRYLDIITGNPFPPGNHRIVLNTEGLTDGVYILSLRTGNGDFIRKLILF